MSNEDDPCPNAATNRAYYAAYQACWVLLADQGVHPPRTERGTYFPHKALPEIAVDSRILTAKQGDRLEFLESQRVIADYFADEVSAKMAQQCVLDAETIVALLDKAS